jgi:hypothetical protein
MSTGRETNALHYGSLDDDERRRMRVNCFSALAVVVLLLIGGWVENGLVNAMRDSHDCYRPGRSSCGSIYMPVAAFRRALLIRQA